MKVFLAIPCASYASNVMGGQVTAARGIIEFVKEKKICHTVVDTAGFGAAKGAVHQKVIKIKTIFQSLICSVIGDYSSALFFKSTNIGLLERFFPALFFFMRGKNVGIFFRNSSIFSLTPGTLKAKFFSFLLKPYSIFFVQGDSWKKHLENLGFSHKQIIVIPNWLPPSFQLVSQSKIKSNKNLLRFLFTGRVVADKGVFELVEAIADTRLASRCELIIAGDGPDLAACEKMVHKKKLSNIRFTGSVSSDEIRSLIDQSDVFVLPTYHEGFPNSILEAMARGLPVISTPVGAIAESVKNGDNGIIVFPKNIESLVNAMHFYVLNPEHIEKHSENALQTVKKRHDRNINCGRIFDSLG